MKTFVITLTTVVLTCLLSPSVVLATDSPDRDRSAQSGTTVVFWTNETSQGPIRVYVNRCYVGTITTSYSSAPRCGAPGCVTVVLPKGGNTWYGVATDGTRWFSGNNRLHRGCNSVRLHHAGVSDGSVPVPPSGRYSSPGNVRLECKDLMGPDRGLCRKGVPYLGLGTGASSMLDLKGYLRLRTACPQLPTAPDDARRVRLTVETPRGELAADPRLSALSFSLEFLTEPQAVAEDLMLGARLVEGLRPELVSRARELFGARFDDTVDALLVRDLLAEKNGRLAPTEQGWLLGNELYGALWDLAPGEVVAAKG